MIVEAMNSPVKKNYAFAISIVGGLFFIFGFVGAGSPRPLIKSPTWGEITSPLRIQS